MSTPSGSQRILVVNCGSSSVKYRLLVPATGEVLASGLVERIGDGVGRIKHTDAVGTAHVDERPFADHAAALDAVLTAFAEKGPQLQPLTAVGHRAVHGGELFAEPTLVDETVLKAIDDLSPLAPLHNPAVATGIRAAQLLLPDLPHVAVFDTAFHRTLPARASTYAVPAEWRGKYGVRRYGFHGTSHAFVSRETARILGRPLEDTNTIVLHLGNGASACAVAGGRSIDTSMGFTPLAGLIMGTRSGDVDPALPEYLQRVAGLDGAAVIKALNSESGLAALSGASDLREVEARAEAGDVDAIAGLDAYCYRIRSYVGAYHAALGRLDAVTFTAGVGENSPVVRAGVVAGLEAMGIEIDAALNEDPAGRGRARVISPAGSKVAVLVVPTDEEREIAQQAMAVVSAAGA